MSEIQPNPRRLFYKFQCDDGSRHLVYNAAAIGNPDDHVANKWYVRPYTVALPASGEIIGPFDTAADAERATRARDR